MDQRNKVIILGGVGLLILAVVLVSLFYFLKFSKSKLTQSASIPNSLARLPSAVITPSATNSVSPIITSTNTNVPVATSNNKTFQGQGFSLSYPNGWGILNCSNSMNFEFDQNGGDMKNVVCDRALKPVTFLVNSGTSCNGETIKIGDKQVTQSKIITDAENISYHWCLKVGNNVFDISHRVSSFGARATSKNDFAKEIEKIITSITANR